MNARDKMEFTVIQLNIILLCVVLLQFTLTARVAANDYLIIINQPVTFVIDQVIIFKKRL